MFFVDLDGTITNLGINNTFDFLRNYLYSCSMLGIMRFHLAELASGLLARFAKNDAMCRRLFLALSTFGLRRSRLNEYATRHWLRLIQIYMNTTVLDLIKKLKNRGYSPILLTSCIEIPSRLIAQSLEFEQCIATKFRYVGDLIIGISEDTHGYLKLKVASDRYGIRILKQSPYVVDLESAKIERPYKFFKKIYLFDQNRVKLIGFSNGGMMPS